MATKYEKLSSLNRGTRAETPNVNFSTTNKDEYETQIRQLRQQIWMQGQFNRADTYVQTINSIYESQRFVNLIDYDFMIKYPIIGRALDCYAEEATVMGRDGKIISVKAKSKRVKKELERLLYDILNIQTNAYMWVRTMGKCGDCFLHLYWGEKGGLERFKIMPVAMMERIEPHIYNPSNIISNSDETFFRCKHDTIQEFKWFQIAHFRMLGDDKFYPYGMSLLENSRRIWRNLILVEDAVRVLRLLRGFDRRVFKIEVGNLPPQDVEPFLDKMRDKIKRRQHVDPNTGEQDLKSYIASIDQDLVIPVRDGIGSSVETLSSGASADAADLNYDLSQLFAALGVPKAFLNYDEIAGEGKGLAMLDVRFSRTVNRIQQSFLMELNKIALIHLHTLGYEEEDLNFSLVMNNPSTVQESLHIELLTAKIQAFSSAVADTGKGLKAMSVAKAMEEILGFSKDEIKANMREQFMEAVIGQEITNAPNVIKTSQLFKDLISLYGAEFDLDGGGVEGDDDNQSEGGDTGGLDLGGGGGGLLGGGGGMPDLGGGEDVPDLGGEGGDLDNLAGDAGNETLEQPAADTTPTTEEPIKATNEALIREFERFFHKINTK